MHLYELDDPTQPARDWTNPLLPGELCGPPGRQQVRVWCRYRDGYHFHGAAEPSVTYHWVPIAGSVTARTWLRVVPCTAFRTAPRRYRPGVNVEKTRQVCHEILHYEFAE
jgi:hypothetical protein